ncbi:competence/damage-inducible protein A [Bdellovibrio svalbardensis]|uniref:Competence/damage-inducible protein A n=1 Tax=Bdellovibrio svalbardensis TaxID=2972972 RepID=A0ABT6DMG0_9BACT|nr:competence/damage-inducible protein A [Bdellovibrio svalbardensis]MDG0817836.1 competence/damage-inducible protein A [Bdellovibrio svalbardensis]
MKATVLGIGTELVDGQIVNKNAAWISEKLKELGLTTALHLVVPDDRKLMTEALDFCASHGDLLFITGGLGPTTDDFTREVVSDWTKRTLKFDEGSWQHIKERLEPRGYVVKDIQRQQCFYPEGATVLKNAEGTANAFFLEANGKKIFVLPGPPREIEAIWHSSIAQWLDKNTTDIDPYITRYWDTIGMGESDVATIVEEALAGIEVEKGYRVHLPYVEVKLSFFKSEEKKFAPYVEKVTAALAHCLITRDQQDVPLLLSRALQSYSSVSVQDSATGQFLMNRLMPVMRDFMTTKSWSFSNNAIDEEAQVRLSLAPRDEHSCIVRIEKGAQKFTDILEAPYKSMQMKERRHQYFAEIAMIFWLKHL